MSDREPLHPIEVDVTLRLNPQMAGILRRLDENTPFVLTALRFEKGLDDHTYVDAELVQVHWDLNIERKPVMTFGPDLLSKRKPHGVA